MMNEQDLDRLAQEQATLIFREKLRSECTIDALMAAFKRGYYAYNSVNVLKRPYGSHIPVEAEQR